MNATTKHFTNLLMISSYIVTSSLLGGWACLILFMSVVLAFFSGFSLEAILPVGLGRMSMRAKAQFNNLFAFPHAHHTFLAMKGVFKSSRYS
jgi:hypothetical protein